MTWQWHNTRYTDTKNIALDAFTSNTLEVITSYNIIDKFTLQNQQATDKGCI